MDFARALARAVVSQILKPTTCSTTQTSAAVDLADYEGKVLIVVNTTKGTDNDETMVPTVIDCDTAGGSYGSAIVTGATVLGGSTSGAADRVVVMEVDASSCKRYVEVVLTVAGTTPAFVAGVTLIGFKKYMA